jgi:hypothetical protein
MTGELVLVVRRLSLVVLLPLATLLATAAPAAAVGPFGPVVTVVNAPCPDFEGVSGDSVVGSDGTIRGFVSFIGGSCGFDPEIIYFEGSGSTWTAVTSPYHGRVLGVAWDGTATFLLHATETAIRITKRDGSTFTPGRVLSGSGVGGATLPSGDVVALAGKFWAVWSEQVGPGGEFAQTELFQAYTMGPGRSRQRITFVTGLDDRNPTLVLAPTRDGQVVMEWVRADIAQGEFSVIRIAGNAPGGSGTGWFSQPYTATNRFAESPDLFLYGGSIFGAYVFDGRVIQATNPPFGVVTNSFALGSSPRIGSSGGRTWVAYDSSGGTSHVRVGEATAPGVRTDIDLTPGAGPQHVISVSGRLARATVLGVSFGTNRLWAQTQTG